MADQPQSDEQPQPSSEDTKVCPFCAETVEAAAVVCHHCGRELPKEGTDSESDDTPEPLSEDAGIEEYIPGLKEDISDDESVTPPSSDKSSGPLIFGAVLLGIFFLFLLVTVGPLLPHMFSSGGSAGAAPDEKFGYSEAERKEIFLELLDEEREVKREAELLFPLPAPGEDASKALEDQELYFRDEQVKYEAKIAEKYDLTVDQLHEIVGEGVEKLWLLDDQ